MLRVFTGPQNLAGGTLTAGTFITLGGLALIAALASVGADGCEKERTVGTSTCLGCHDGRTAPDKLEIAKSPHADVDCETCHGPGFLHVRDGGEDLDLIDNPGDRPFLEAADLCRTCHETSVDGYRQMAHFTEEAVTCLDCHDVHARRALAISLPEGASQEDVFLRVCGTCHEAQINTFLLSQHALSGAASCHNCHDVHKPGGLAFNFLNNEGCLQCHGTPELGFDTEEAIDFHTGFIPGTVPGFFFHPVEPEAFGSSRCIGCHLPPLQQEDQANADHDHSLFTIPPSTSIEALDAGIEPVPFNTCAGVTGCHDPNIPQSGAARDPSDRGLLESLQWLYERVGGILEPGGETR